MSNPTLDTIADNATGGASSSLSWYHTCDASATLLTVHVSYTTSATISATYHGKPMQLVQHMFNQAVFQLANPDTGSGYQVVVSASSAVLDIGFSSSWIGAGTMVGRTTKSGSANSAWLNGVVSAVGNLVLDFVAVPPAEYLSATPTPRGTQIQAYGNPGASWGLWCSYMPGAATVNIGEDWASIDTYTYMTADMGVHGGTPPRSTAKVTICIVGG